MVRHLDLLITNMTQGEYKFNWGGIRSLFQMFCGVYTFMIVPFINRQFQICDFFYNYAFLCDTGSIAETAGLTIINQMLYRSGLEG